MVSYIGNNIKPKGVGLIPSRKVIEGGYRTIIGNSSGLFSSPFTTEWTVAGDAAARTITLPLVQSRIEGPLAYNCVVDWGDGSTPSLVTSYNDVNRIHTYALDGTYRVKIYGTLEGWSFNNGGDKLKITKVIHWGKAPIFEGFKYLREGFYGCSNLTSIGTSQIPASGNGVETDGFLGTFRSTGITEVPPNLFQQHTLNPSFNTAFYGSDLVTLPASLFSGCSSVTNFFQCFRSCYSLVSLPSGLFDDCTAAISFYQTFLNCTSITSIPSGLFDNNTLVSTFYATFNGCSGLTGAIPTGLLDNNTLVTNIAWMFSDCSGLTGNIPTGLLDNNTLVTNAAGMFYNCSGLTGNIPTGFLDSLTQVTSLAYLFQGCSGLTGYGANLCRLNTVCTDFRNFMRNCISMQQRIDTFYASGEEGTRFLNQDVDFTSCFQRDSFTGTQGTAPDLWNCSFGTGTPTTTDCWEGAGNSTSSLTNYTSIPGAWI